MKAFYNGGATTSLTRRSANEPSKQKAYRDLVEAAAQGAKKQFLAFLLEQVQ